MFVGLGGWRGLSVLIILKRCLLLYCNTKFEDMSTNLHIECNGYTRSKASNHLKLVTSFDFIVALVITRNVFYLTSDVTQVLQVRNKDICDTVLALTK